jgi:hypothetical protein
MKDLIKEIKRATSLREAWKEVKLLHYLINKRHFDFVFQYLESKETVQIFDSNELVGILHARLSIGFIHEKVYEDFIDLDFYHLIKVDSFEKDEWGVDKQEMKKIAPKITWRSEDAVVNSKKFSVLDFKYATG